MPRLLITYDYRVQKLERTFGQIWIFSSKNRFESSLYFGLTNISNRKTVTENHQDVKTEKGNTLINNKENVLDQSY